MPQIDNPYSEENLTAARNSIAPAHSEALSIGQECYERLCGRLTGANYEAGSPEEAAFALSCRVLELSAMSLLCLRNGSIPAAKILTRSALEAAFKIVAIRRDPKNLEQFMEDENAARLLFRRNLHICRKDKAPKSAAEKLEREISELAAKKPQKIKPAEWATRAQMVDFYRLFYSWLSSDVHGNAAAIDPYFESQMDNALQIGPNYEGLAMTVMILSRCLVAVLCSLASPEDRELEAWHEAIEKRLFALEQVDG